MTPERWEMVLEGVQRLYEQGGITPASDEDVREAKRVHPILFPTKLLGVDEVDEFKLIGRLIRTRTLIVGRMVPREDIWPALGHIADGWVDEVFLDMPPAGPADVEGLKGRARAYLEG